MKAAQEGVHMLSEIVLPTGTDRVVVGDIPALFADAAYKNEAYNTLEAEMMRLVLVEEWKRQVVSAVFEGRLTPRSRTSFVPRPQAIGEELFQRCVVTVEDLTKYAASLDFGVRMESPTDNSNASPAFAEFREMVNLSPTEVTIDFAAGDSGSCVLNISARDVTRRVALAEFDLFDRRKAQMNTQGVLLLGMARTRKVSCPNNAKAKQLSRLRTAFRTHLGILADPFLPYNENAGYEPLFAVTDSRNAADERAKREAKLKTDSIDSPGGIVAVEKQQFEESQRSNYEPDEFGDDETAQWLNSNDLSR